MRPLFHDPTLQEQYDRDGYVTLDFLRPEEIEKLWSFLEELKEEGKQFGMNTESEYKLSFFSKNSDWRKKVLEMVGDFFQPMVDRHLRDYKPLIINLFDKEPGGGEVPVHQNWTFVDESKYRSVSVWIPLCDVSRANGTLEVIKGSHDTLTPYRSPSIPWCFDGLWDPLREKYLQPLNLRLGQAGIIDDAILHWSSDNDTDQVRSTIQLIMIPAEAPAIHYYRNPEQPEKLDIFEVDADFFTKFNMHEKPDGVEKVGEVDFEYHKLSESELVEKVAVRNPAIRELQ